jgi:excinuclease ABC subunit B
MTREQLEKAITAARKNMERTARELDFIEAARYRDEVFSLEALLKEKFGN